MNLDNQIVIYEGEKGETQVSVKLHEETVWLTLNQMAELFERDKSVISKHLKNIFTEQELYSESTIAKFATVQDEGSRKVIRHIEYYNLDAILSVGYRVNSKKGIQFRRWASNILKDHLIKGYSLNQQKLLEGKIAQLQQAIELMSATLENQGLLDETGKQVLNIVRSYSKTWDVLVGYDENNLNIPKNLHDAQKEIIEYNLAKQAIEEFKNQIGAKGLFGIERDQYLKAILGNIAQTFSETPLYSSIEERAAHLLYFIIKDHPFSDGNKRIGSFLFLLYLRYAELRTDHINENALIALALLVAESAPTQKEIMIKLILNLISR